MEQPASANVPIGTTLASENIEYFTVYPNPLVQLPPIDDASMHSSLEGCVNSPTPPDYGPDAPFWRTSMGQDIAEFEVIRPSLGNPHLGEDGISMVTPFSPSTARGDLGGKPCNLWD